MYKILRTGFWRPKARLLAPDGIDAGEEFNRMAVDLHTFVRKAHKTGFVAARVAGARQAVVTHWNGQETTNTAEPGDFVVTNLGPDRVTLLDRSGNVNVYVIAAARFPDLYEPDSGQTKFGEVYRAKGVVDALYLSGGFILKAPWGELQQADEGYLLRNGREVYGNSKETFERTYQMVTSA